LSSGRAAERVCQNISQNIGCYRRYTLKH